MGNVTQEDVFNVFLEWKPWYIEKIQKTNHPCDADFDEIFDEVLIHAVPTILKNCDSKKNIGKLVCGPLAEKFIWTAINHVHYRREIIETNLKGSRAKREERDNLPIGVTFDPSFDNIVNAEDKDAWYWILYRSSPIHKPWLDGYRECNGNMAALAKLLQMTRQNVSLKFSRFFSEARAIINVRKPVAGFAEHFDRSQEFLGGICRCCGKLLDIMTDEYCNDRCRSKGPNPKAIKRRWGKYFSEQRIKNIKNKHKRPKPVEQEVPAFRVYKVIDGRLLKVEN